MNRFASTLVLVSLTLASGHVSAQVFATPPPNGGNATTTTVSFGQWMTSTPLDRWPNSSPTRTNNRFAMGPNHVSIRAGSYVSFIVSGLHNISIYDDGVQPSEVDTTLLTNTTGTPNDVPVINDPKRRIYRGLDPSLQALDRVEVVQFPKPGIYLVICGIFPHFRAGMYGYVEVLP